MSCDFCNDAWIRYRKLIELAKDFERERRRSAGHHAVVHCRPKGHDVCPAG